MIRVGLCPDRLVVTRRRHALAPVEGAIHAVSGDPVASLADMAADERIAVILSSHFVRYSVLPWSEGLTSQADWLAFAEHNFESVYGAAAVAQWRIHVCGSAREPRVATAVDAALIGALRSVPKVVSVQPYLMAAFNGRRGDVVEDAWLVLQETGRLTLALISKGEWRLARTRRIDGDWLESLPVLLDRESAAVDDKRCDTVLLCSETEGPAQAGRYRITDITLRRRAKPALRQYAMALH